MRGHSRPFGGALNKGVLVPDHCLLDGQGKPTNDPKAFYASPPGAILPFGGHKGYGLSVIVEGLIRTAMAGLGVVSGAVAGFVLARFAAGYIQGTRMPGALTIAGAAVILIAAAIVASLVPAARASRIDVIEALRAE